MSSLVDVAPPSDTFNPSQVDTYDGAIGLYAGTIRTFAYAYGGALSNDIVISGIFTDELQNGSGWGDIDSRVANAGTGVTGLQAIYKQWQQVRAQGDQAVGMMRHYTDRIPQPLIGRVYALVGYTELILAERFCSGIPFSTASLGGGTMTYAAGSTTTETLERAIAHFDTAYALAGDSVRYKTLALVGKARALTDLDRLDEAHALLADVPTSYTYTVDFSTQTGDTNAVHSTTQYFVTDQEGANGLNWLVPADPRIPTQVVTSRARTMKYNGPNVPIPLASGLEARLLDAEALLRHGDAAWLTTLNALRTNGTYTVTGTDTAWAAGTGGVAGLEPLADPGTDSARVDLLFRERGFWLYLTGHRQGDLRRLVRQYQRSAAEVYPAGVYLPASTMYPFYGSDVVMVVPATEHQTNGKYQGCVDLNA